MELIWDDESIWECIKIWGESSEHAKLELFVLVWEQILGR